MKAQSLRQLYKIMEYKDGCVYKTQYLYDVWVDLDTRLELPADTQLVSLSTKRIVELNYKTNRTVSNDTPSIVKVQ